MTPIPTVREFRPATKRGFNVIVTRLINHQYRELARNSACASFSNGTQWCVVYIPESRHRVEIRQMNQYLDSSRCPLKLGPMTREQDAEVWKAQVSVLNIKRQMLMNNRLHRNLESHRSW